MAWITVPRLLVALGLSALATRTSSVGTAGPGVRGVAAGFLNWDAAHYMQIAAHGYTSRLDTLFFPLDPLLIRLGAYPLGYPNAAIAVSWVALGFAVWGVVDLAGRLTSRRGAVAAGLLLAWNPVSVFLVSGYAESLLVATTVWSLRFCLQRRWLPAAVLAGAASAVVPQGAVAAGVVVVGILIAERGVARIALAIGCGILSEAGLIAFALFSQRRFGNPLEFRLIASTYWHEHVTYPLHIVVQDLRLSGLLGGTTHLVTETHFIWMVDAAAGIAAVGAVVVALARCRSDHRWVLPTLSLVLGASLSLAIIDSWGDGVARFITALAGMYLVTALVFDRMSRRHLWPLAVVLVPSVALAVYTERLYHMAHWVT